MEAMQLKAETWCQYSYFRYAVMYPMWTRDEVFEKLEFFIADGGSSGTLASDGSQE